MFQAQPDFPQAPFRHFLFLACILSFQKRQYGPIEIVSTEMKGFGIRAKKDIPK